ncbi:MAG: hypothetical protein JWO36_6655 [Myxococcales bacterium]|nr:hypothetical protein [Myxococcales bacterium]
MTRSRPFALVLVLAAGCGTNDRAEPGTCGTTNSGMGVLKDFTPPCDPGPSGITFSASGEVLALGGYRFPPASPNDVAFVDGWDITYDRVLTTFDKVTLSDNPDKSPTDQSQTGAVIAEIDGPFAVDLHKGGSLAGKGGGDEQAVPVASINGRNKQSGNPALDPTVRYAFGFDIISATAAAKNINLDAADLADYQEMITKGYTTLLVGTAVWKGDSTCTSTIAGYDFTKIPKTVKFRLGLTAPTSYVNAQNPENDPAAPFANEEHQRGVQTTQNAVTVAQVTFHLDHVFWESFVHDSPAHFDQFAATKAGMTGVPTVTMEDVKARPFTPFVDALQQPLPWRTCLATYTPPVTTGAMKFDTLSVPVNPTGDPHSVMRDFFDYTLYNHSTFGHLNSDGLSFVQRNYASPP